VSPLGNAGLTAYVNDPYPPLPNIGVKGVIAIVLMKEFVGFCTTSETGVTTTLKLKELVDDWLA
jgi:hypothetical protein